MSLTVAAPAASTYMLIDEFGYLQLDRRGAELLFFEVLTDREEPNGVIASN